jgi:hypothetical protein
MDVCGVLHVPGSDCRCGSTVTFPSVTPLLHYYTPTMARRVGFRMYHDVLGDASPRRICSRDSTIKNTT